MSHPEWHGGRQFKKKNVCASLSASKDVAFNLNKCEFPTHLLGTDEETEAWGSEITCS